MGCWYLFLPCLAITKEDSGKLQGRMKSSEISRQGNGGRPCVRGPRVNPSGPEAPVPTDWQGQVSPLIERMQWSLEREEVAYNHQVLTSGLFPPCCVFIHSPTYKASEVWEPEMPPLLTEPDLLLSKGIRPPGKKCEAHLAIRLLRCKR